MGKIIYNKVKSGKHLGGGGPRDRQTALKMKQQQDMMTNLRPSMTAETQKSKPDMVDTQPKAAPAQDMTQYLPLKEVKKKIEEAVAAVRDGEQQKFQSGLNNINDQLKNERRKVAKASEELLNAKVEIKRLRSQVSETPTIPMEVEKRIMEKDSEISTLNAQMTAKGELYDKAETELNKLRGQLENISETGSGKDENIGKLKSDLKTKTELCEKLDRDVKFYSDAVGKKDKELIEITATMKSKEEMFTKSDGDMKEIQNKMDKLYNKIADGSIKHLVGSKMDRPALEDKIFIDPLEKGKEPKLDAHIEVEEEKPIEDAEERDMMTDLAKLKGLLKLD